MMRATLRYDNVLKMLCYFRAYEPIIIEEVCNCLTMIPRSLVLDYHVKAWRPSYEICYSLSKNLRLKGPL